MIVLSLYRLTALQELRKGRIIEANSRRWGGGGEKEGEGYEEIVRFIEVSPPSFYLSTYNVLS